MSSPVLPRARIWTPAIRNVKLSKKAQYERERKILHQQVRDWWDGRLNDQRLFRYPDRVPGSLYHGVSVWPEWAALEALHRDYVWTSGEGINRQQFAMIWRRMVGTMPQRREPYKNPDGLPATRLFYRTGSLFPKRALDTVPDSW